jgi:hypothetical protein
MILQATSSKHPNHRRLLTKRLVGAKKKNTVATACLECPSAARTVDVNGLITAAQHPRRVALAV